tara:strand:- start:1715 stop:2023 length:309 start_codon:yes stop_codon:yes gene_type:complete
MSVPNKVTISHIFTVLRSAMFEKNTKIMGRWGNYHNEKHVGLKSNYSNEDHCGTCSEYALTKKQKHVNTNLYNENLYNKNLDTVYCSPHTFQIKKNYPSKKN